MNDQDKKLINILVFVVVASVVVLALIVSKAEKQEVYDATPTSSPKPVKEKTKREKIGEYVGDSSRKFFRGVIKGIKDESK